MMRKYVFFLIGLLATTFPVLAQFDPISWTAQMVPTPENEVYVMEITAHIDGGWHLYSQDKYPSADIAPTPTEFLFENPDKGYELRGGVQDPQGKQKVDPVFGFRIKYFQDKAVFKQFVKRTDPALNKVDASVFYVVCDHERCLAPEEKFITISFPNTTQVSAKTTVQSSDVKKKSTLFSQLKKQYSSFTYRF